MSDTWGVSDGASLIRPTFHRGKFIWRRSEKAQPPSDIVQTDHRRWWFPTRSPRRCFGSGVSIGVVWKWWGMSDGALLIQPTFHRDRFIWRWSEKAQPPSDIVQTDHRRWWFPTRSPRRCFGSGVGLCGSGG